MEKIMVNVYVPSLQESYDVYIPTELKITQLCSLLAEGIHSLSGGKYGVSGTEFLCLAAPNMLLNGECTPQDYALVNGDRLVII